MNFILTRNFQKAFRKLDATTKRRILIVINEVKAAQSLQQVKSVKPMSNYSNFYRIREGNYRVGIYVTADALVQFLDVGPRGDFYNSFP
jgi:mRNA interferase RelE/StbE